VIDGWIEKRYIAVVDLIGRTSATVSEVCVLVLGQGDEIKNGDTSI
jgi:hypothetical protein